MKKARIQRATDLEGVSLSDLVVCKAYAAAEEVIRAYEVLELTEHDSVRFVEAFLDPPEPNEHLRCAFDRHRTTFSR